MISIRSCCHCSLKKAYGYTVNDVAHFLNISPRRVQQLSKKGTIPKEEHGCYNLIAVIHAYCAHLRGLAGRLGKSPVKTETSVRIRAQEAMIREEYESLSLFGTEES